jgi:F0F1-type ATP synthase membrane subunit a
MKFVRSFVPFGRPLLLSFFLNIIEVVRVLIRLLTLAVRLMVNVTTGHIFLGLLGGVVVFSGGALVIVGLYFSFEVGIMLIQSYVFSLLVLQYVEV